MSFLRKTLLRDVSNLAYCCAALWFTVPGHNRMEHMMILFVFHLPWLLSVSIVCTVDWNLCFFVQELYQFMEFRRTTQVHKVSVATNFHPSFVTR